MIGRRSGFLFGGLWPIFFLGWQRLFLVKFPFFFRVATFFFVKISGVYKVPILVIKNRPLASKSWRFMGSTHVVVGHLFAKGVTEPIYFFGWGFTWVFLGFPARSCMSQEVSKRLGSVGCNPNMPHLYIYIYVITHLLTIY